MKSNLDLNNDSKLDFKSNKTKFLGVFMRFIGKSGIFFRFYLFLVFPRYHAVPRH